MLISNRKTFALTLATLCSSLALAVSHTASAEEPAVAATPPMVKTAGAPDMSQADFAEALDDFREFMNDQNDCAFKPLSQASIRQIYKAYEKGLAARSGT